MKRDPSEQKLWFRAKEYGWGWYPVSWQGWAITALFAVLYTVSFIGFAEWLGAAKQSGGFDTHGLIWALLEFFLWIAFLTYALIHICTRKGEKPKWRWGNKKI